MLGLTITIAVIVVSSTGYKGIPNSIAIYSEPVAISLVAASLLLISVPSLPIAAVYQELVRFHRLVRYMGAVNVT